MEEPSRAAELGAFLRTRRHRLTPGSVGLVAGPGRRTPGLRREEVAGLAHVSTAWYTHLEQGRRVRPSPEVLDSLATTLLLGPAERRYLHALAATPSPPVPSSHGPEALAIVRGLVDAGGTPRPVYAVDAGGSLLAANAAMAEWYDDIAGRPGRGRNIVWWMFTEPVARERIAGWDADADDLVARIRYFHGLTGLAAEGLAMLRDLRALSPEFRRRWESHDVTDQVARDRTFRHPRLGVQTLRLAVVRPVECPSVTVVFHLST